jgi:PAS domain S-box-containing protein
MTPISKTEQALQAENTELRARLEDTEETLRAIRDDEVDAIIAGEQVYLFEKPGTSSNRYRGEVLAQVNDAVIAVDNDMRVTYFNLAAEQKYGVTATDALGRLLDEIYEYRWVRPDDETNALEALAASGNWRGENIHVTRDGTEFLVESVVNHLRDENGIMIGTLAVIRDITERKRDEAARAQLAAIVDSTADAIYSYDLDLRVLSWNKGAENLYGWTSEEIIGQPIMAIVPPDQTEETLKIFNSVLKNDQSVINLETVRKRRDGSYVDVRVTGSPIKGPTGKTIAFSVIAHDISSRKRAESDLHRSQARIAADLQAMTQIYEVGNFCLRPENGFDQCLQSILETAISVTRAQKGNIQLLDHASGSLVIAAQIGFDQPFLDFFAHVTDEFSACGRAFQCGERVVVEDVMESEIFAGQPSLDVLLEAGIRAVQSTLLMSAAGKLLGIISTHFSQPNQLGENELRKMDLLARQAADFLERKQAEGALRAAYEQESTARAEAETANRSKDEFLAVVSHELRSPLTSILGYNRMLRAKPGDLVLLKTSCDVIERNARLQLQLIEDLLDSARIASGKLRLEMEKTDIHTILADALDVVRPMAENKGITLRTKLNIKQEIIICDAARMRQVVWNLLSNAIKFTQEGGSVELRTEQSIEQVHIIVSDNGKGIEPKFLPYLFDRFRQEDSSAARRHGGLGLGLSLVKHLVELHGGEVMAASEGADRGSTFTIMLPREGRSAKTIEEPPPITAIAAAGKTNSDGANPLLNGMLAGMRVLAVDDQQDAREMLTKFLSKSGAVVTTAASGGEALEYLSSLSAKDWPEILVCDIAMPDEDGYSVLARVRTLEQKLGIKLSARLPAIALTAMARSRDRLLALAAGYQMHIPKPVDPAELLLVISSLVGRFNGELDLSSHSTPHS